MDGVADPQNPTFDECRSILMQALNNLEYLNQFAPEEFGSSLGQEAEQVLMHAGWAIKDEA